MVYIPRKCGQDCQGVVIERSSGKPVGDLNRKKPIINIFVDTAINILSMVKQCTPVMDRSAHCLLNVGLTRRSRGMEQA